jgi:hypothetical protein
MIASFVAVASATGSQLLAEALSGPRIDNDVPLHASKPVWEDPPQSQQFWKVTIGFQDVASQ